MLPIEALVVGTVQSQLLKNPKQTSIFEAKSNENRNHRKRQRRQRTLQWLNQSGTRDKVWPPRPSRTGCRKNRILGA